MTTAALCFEGGLTSAERLGANGRELSSKSPENCEESIHKVILFKTPSHASESEAEFFRQSSGQSFALSFWLHLPSCFDAARGS